MRQHVKIVKYDLKKYIRKYLWSSHVPRQCKSNLEIYNKP